MARQKSRVQLESEWWDAWREKDFSWEGLASKDWIGWAVTPKGEIVEMHRAPKRSRAATLQDYWRDEEPHLIAGDGKRWTRAHLPLYWADGTHTGKLHWSDRQRDTLAAVLSAKLAESSEKDASDGNAIGVDPRAQMQGTVLPGVPPVLRRSALFRAVPHSREGRRCVP
jgi:hypothetical protein